MMEYFDTNNTKEVNKDLYKMWCKKLHPDMPTGDKVAFIEMKNQYDNLLLKKKTAPKNHSDQKKENNYPKNEYSELEKIFDIEKDKLKHEATTHLKKAGINSFDDLFELVANSVIQNFKGKKKQ